MKDRFDLEDEIMKLHAFVDNIENAVEYLAESDVDPKVIDTVSNILLGTSTLMGLHAEKMLDTMCQCFKLDQYRHIEEQEQVDDMKYKLKKCCNKWKWDTTSSNPIHDMSYDPEGSELSVEIPLTNADNRVTTKCSGKYHSTMTSFGYQ